MVAPLVDDAHDAAIHLYRPTTRQITHVHAYDHNALVYWASLLALLLGVTLILIALCARPRMPDGRKRR